MKRFYFTLAAALIAASVLAGCEHYRYHRYGHEEEPEYREHRGESHEGYREGDRERYEGEHEEGHEEGHHGY